ncbi:MAG: C4-type zinc ribbon domain-containing protein [candidate division KSB1 bacterium]|nr:C4-type zinc ribbon domain-containing protein [candidate division KSB1 bacterium]MDZ7364616.1 C4-type zinc ribbon domain-containing protein [candidate division KSB1 bacterium]MDZ7402636.1 C4-type zinc ribbon domain-containing protein [candidate division KSB1 bacterium]
MSGKIKTQIEFLVALQDLDIMIKEIEEVKELGFEVKGEGLSSLMSAREDLVQKIKKPLLAAYERLRNRYKRAIVPVKDDNCLGCFMKLPTSITAHGRTDKEVLICENCGRILYWLS